MTSISCYLLSIRFAAVVSRHCQRGATWLTAGHSLRQRRFSTAVGIQTTVTRSPECEESPTIAPCAQVRPSYVESSVQKRTTSSVAHHLLASYQRAHIAIIKAQFTTKRLANGMSVRPAVTAGYMCCAPGRQSAKLCIGNSGCCEPLGTLHAARPGNCSECRPCSQHWASGSVCDERLPDCCAPCECTFLLVDSYLLHNAPHTALQHGGLLHCRGCWRWRRRAACRACSRPRASRTRYMLQLHL